MPNSPSIMALHLRYRLWIAEINFDINVLRIFEDYMESLSSNLDVPEVKTGVEHFKARFKAIRKDIDDLRHEMHLLKMKLAAYSRQKIRLDYKEYKEDNHISLKSHYRAFRSQFEKLKKEFAAFEGKWLA